MCQKQSEFSQNPSHFEGSDEVKDKSQNIHANFLDYNK